MTIETRPAEPADAPQMRALLNAIIEKGGTTAHRKPFDLALILKYYVHHAQGIQCTVAVEGGKILGFQSLECADPSVYGPDAQATDWAIIATFVAMECHGKGVGQLLFAVTHGVAKAAGVKWIDATIRQENTGGQGFYARLGFEPYRTTPETVTKVYDLATPRP